MNSYRVDSAVQLPTGKVSKHSNVVIAESPEAAGEAILCLYSEAPSMHCAITEVEVLAAGDLFAEI